MLVTQYQQFVMYTMSEKIMDNINSIIGDQPKTEVHNQLNIEGGKT
jgi:hypothetical protein